LAEIVEISRKHKAWLMIDDAHATGVFGERGIGIAEHLGLLGKIDIVMGTLSKALGSQGGFVCGSKELIDFLVNRARPFIFTTALSPVSCAAAIAALDLVAREPWKRKGLLQTSQKLKDDLRKRFPSGSKPDGGPASQIIPFWTGTPERTLALSGALRESGIFAPAIRPPTVPGNECRLRFSLTSEHTGEDIEMLLETLSGVYSPGRLAEANP
jgi:8-amino-7-oxononanoate synthase